MQVAMRDILRNVRQNLPPGAGEDPKILVPKRGKKKCSWAQEGEVWGHASINFSTMLEVIDFDLDNCYVITYDGRLLKQARGMNPDGECALATAGDRDSCVDGARVDANARR